MLRKIKKRKPIVLFELLMCFSLYVCFEVFEIFLGAVLIELLFIIIRLTKNKNNQKINSLEQSFYQTLEKLSYLNFKNEKEKNELILHLTSLTNSNSKLSKEMLFISEMINKKLNSKQIKELARLGLLLKKDSLEQSLFIPILFYILVLSRVTFSLSYGFIFSNQTLYLCYGVLLALLFISYYIYAFKFLYKKEIIVNSLVLKFYCYTIIKKRKLISDLKSDFFIEQETLELDYLIELIKSNNQESINNSLSYKKGLSNYNKKVFDLIYNYYTDSDKENLLRLNKNLLIENNKTFKNFDKIALLMFSLINTFLIVGLVILL